MIVTYNSESTIESCLRSLSSVLNRFDEILVVDNNSADGTCGAVEQFTVNEPRCRLFQNPQNIGFSRAVNQGFLSSRGDILVSLNPDTVVYDGFIEAFVRVLANLQIGAVGPVSDYAGSLQAIQHYMHGGQGIGTQDLHRFLSQNYPRRVDATKLLIGFCIAFRRAVLDQVGLLDENLLLGADDLEISWRLRELGYQLAIAADTFVHHKGSVSFSTVTSGERERLIAASDRALVQKLSRYYGVASLPSSSELFDSEIFAGALSRFV